MSGVSCATIGSPKTARIFSGSGERFLSYQTAGKREYKTGVPVKVQAEDDKCAFLFA